MRVSRNHLENSSMTQERENEDTAQVIQMQVDEGMNLQGIYDEKSQDWVTDQMIRLQKERDREDSKFVNWKM